MGKKKGNTLIIMLVFVFFISAFMGCFILINNITSGKLKKYIINSNNSRSLELEAYKFYLSNDFENEEFIIDGDLIYVKDMKNIYFEVVIENNVFGIRKEVIE